MSAARHSPVPTARGALLLVLGLTGGVALVGYLIALVTPAPYEFVAFVRGGSLERQDVVPRADVMDRINGLAAAADVAKHLDTSPWLIWRAYTVTTEGQMYVIRVRTPDATAGQRLVELVQARLADELKERYDAAIAPHQAYIRGLEAEVAQLGDEANRLDARAKGDPRASTAAVDRWVALAEIRKQLRDAQLFAALSEAPAAVDGVRRLEVEARSRQLRLALTGALVGLAVALGAIVVLAFRARSVQALAGV